jgi:hypothetical protein
MSLCKYPEASEIKALFGGRFRIQSSRRNKLRGKTVALIESQTKKDLERFSMKCGFCTENHWEEL